MNDFDDLDQLERDFGPALQTALRQVASQIRPEDMPRLDSGEILTGYVTFPSRERPLPDEHRKAPRRGALLIGALSVAAAVVAVALLDRPSHHPAPPIQSPSTTAALGPSTSTSPPSSAPSGYSSLLDVGTGKRSPLPAGLVEGFGLGAYASGYVPSPDGTRVVGFIPCAPPKPCAGNFDMAVGNVDGSDVRTIAVPDGRRLNGPFQGWSPDGTKIVFEAIDDSGGNLGELFIEDVTTGAQTQITHLERRYGGAWPLSPVFTRDGQNVLFMLPNLSGLGDSDVWSVPAVGGEPTLAIHHAAFPAPLPDGKTIAYVSGGGLAAVIWIATIDDPGSARRLTAARGVFGMAVSPDGTRLIYYEDGRGTNVVDVATGSLEYVLDGRAVWLDKDTLIVTQ